MITALIIDEFRNHRKTALTLDHVNVFCGARGSGKSSILAAMQFLLTGRTEWTNDAGKGLDEHIRDGAKKAKIMGVIDGTTYERSIPSKGQPEISWSKDLIAACLRSRRILELSDKEQKDLIFSVLKPEADFDEIIRLLNEWTPEFPDLGDVFARDYPESDPPMYDYCYAERASANKATKKAQGAMSIDVLDTEPKPVPPDVLQAARENYEAALKTSGSQEEVVRAAGRAHLVEMEAWKTQKAAYDRHFAELQLMEAQLGPTDCVPERTWRAPKEIDGDLKSARKMLDNLRASIGGLMDKEVCEEGKCAKSEVKGLRAKEKDMVLREREISTELAKATQAENNLKEKAAKFEQIRQRVTELRGITCPMPGPMPEAPPNQGVGTPEIDLVNAKAILGTMEDGVKDRERWLRDHDRRRQAELDLNEAELSARRWDALVKAFSPDGLKSKMLEKAIGPFTDRLTEHLDFFNWSGVIDMDEWSITIAIPDKGIRPARFLSWSEKVIVNTCIQAALAEMSGVPFIAIDQHDLGPTDRSDFYDFLLSLPVQSFLFSTIQEQVDGELKAPVDPGINGLAVFFVENGTVKRAQDTNPLLNLQN